MRVPEALLGGLLVGLACCGCGPAAAPAPSAPESAAVPDIPAVSVAEQSPPAPAPRTEDPPQRLELRIPLRDQDRFKARALNMMTVLKTGESNARQVRAYLQQCITLDPGNAYYHEKLGLMLLSDRKGPDKGIALLEKAAALGTVNTQVYFRLGRHYEDQGTIDRAVTYYEGFISLSPSLTEAADLADGSWRGGQRSRGFQLRQEYRRLEIVLKKLGDFHRASGNRAALEKVLIQLATRKDSARAELVSVYIYAQDFARAFQMVNSIKNVYDLGEEHFIHVIDAYTALLRVPGFLPPNTRQGIHDKVRQHVDVYNSIKGVSGPVLLAGARQAAGRGEAAEVQHYAERMYREVPDPGSFLGALSLLAEMGAADVAVKVIDAAEKDLGRALRPDIRLLKIALSPAGEDRKRDLDAVLKDIPKGSENLYRIQVGSFLVRMERYPDAVEQFERCIQLMSDSTAIEDTTEIEVQLAYALYKAGEKKRGFGLLEDVIKRQGDQSPADVENLLGYMLALEGRDLKRAVQLVQKALAKSPDNGAFADSLGWAYFKSGNMEQAGRFLKRAAVLLPDAEVLAHLGDYYSAIGDREQARRSWIAALLHRENAEVRKKLLELGADPHKPDKE
ncbi:tetratricopeptide repeat protein [Planctomycetota bacterium]